MLIPRGSAPWTRRLPFCCRVETAGAPTTIAERERSVQLSTVHYPTGTCLRAIAGWLPITWRAIARSMSLRADVPEQADGLHTRS
jgi:hypothetical protein